MIETKTNAALYTVLKNNTDKRILLTAYGKLKNGNIAPKGCIAYPGYILEDVPDMRMSNVLATMRNGSISIFIIVRTVDGYKAMELGADMNMRFTDADAQALYSQAARPQSNGRKTEEIAHNKVPANVTQHSADGFTVLAAGKSSKVADMIGAKIADSPATEHAPLNTDLSKTHGAAKIAAGNIDEIKAAAKAKNDVNQQADVVEEKPAEEAPVREALAAAVADCYVTKDWDKLLELLQTEWPDIEFTKASVMRLKSLDNIMSKYALV